MRRSKGVLTSLLIWTGGVASCPEPLKTPSAYESAHYLCDDEHAADLEASVSHCRDTDFRDGSCSGVASMKLDLGTQQAIIESDLVLASYSSQDPQTRVAGGFGKSPYFNFFFMIALTTPSLSASGATSESDESCQSAATGSTLFGFQVRGASETLPFTLTSCSVNARDGVRIRYAGDVLEGGTLKGCLHILPKGVER